MTEKCPLCKCSPCKCYEDEREIIEPVQILTDALKEIANMEPETVEVNYSDSIGWIENCTTCEEMIEIAKSALEKYKENQND